MRFKTLALAAAVATVLTAPVFAELQNVEVGGEIRIRGNMYTDGIDFGPLGAVGTPFVAQPGFDDDGELKFIEQRTRLNVTADFTDDVTAFVEIDNYSSWGTATRQANPFGANATGQASVFDDVDMYQAYIEMREAWGQPLTVRIGRQEIVLGNEWLVGNNDTAAFFTGLSFDAVTARWDFDGGNIFGWAAKVVELDAFTNSSDDDTDFYGLYLTYDGLEMFNVDAYWMYLRDASGFGGLGNAGPPLFVGSDEVGDFHTVGARIYGDVAGFDYDVQAAYQFGEADAFAGSPDIDAWAADATVGYLFENISNLYIWAGAAYFEGSDDLGDDLSFLRMFSDVEYSEFLADSDMSNVLILRGGASIQATESIEVSGVVSWFKEDEDFGGDDGIGIEAALYASYDYSEDLNFNAGWAHFFADDDLDDGAAIPISGLATLGGGDDDIDYFFIETVISF